MKQDKLCFLLNYAPHYRFPIYKLINDNINCDFYFGNETNALINKIEYKELSNFKKELKRVNFFSNFHYLKGSVSLIWNNYSAFVLTGEPYCLSNWILLLYCKLFRKKSYLWGHGWYGKETKLIAVVKKMFHKLSDGVFLYGDYAKKLMLEEGFEENKLIPIYNSLDYDAHIKIRANLKATDIYSKHFTNNYPTLIYVGRIQKSKRIDMVFEAIKHLNKTGTKVNFVIVGNYTDVDLSIDTIENRSIKNQIWLYGPCYEEEKLGELFYNATVCVSPGNVGLTAIHSLSFGTPVITHNNFPYQGPEFEAIIEGETGSFFEENNVDDLTEKIIHYLNVDSEKCEAIKEASFKIIDERYNPYYQLDVIKRTLDNNLK